MVTLDFFLDAKIQDAEKDRLLWIGMIGGRAYAVVFEVLGTEADLDYQLTTRQPKGEASHVS